MKTNSFAEGVNFGNQALSSAFFKPNIIFLSMLERKESIKGFPTIMTEAKRLGLGVILYVPHPRALLGQEQKINVWIDDRAGQWNIDKGTGSIDLPILTAFKLMQNWNADIRLISVVNNKDEKKSAKRFLKDIVELARLPITDTEVMVGEMDSLIKNGPYADINIFATEDNINLDYCADMINQTETSCLFIQDSGNENILA